MDKSKLTYKEAFQGPFYMDDHGCYIWCKNIYGHEQMCFTILDWERPEEAKRLKRIVSLLNQEHDAKPFKYAGYNFEEDIITAGDTVEEANNPLLLMRGWGYLTGCGALDLDPKHARQIQLDFMQWAIQRIKDDDTIEFKDIKPQEE